MYKLDTDTLATFAHGVMCMMQPEPLNQNNLRIFALIVIQLYGE